MTERLTQGAIAEIDLMVAGYIEGGMEDMRDTVLEMIHNSGATDKDAERHVKHVHISGPTLVVIGMDDSVHVYRVSLTKL